MKDLQSSIQEWITKKGHRSFDCFLIQQMGYTLEGKDDTGTRQRAYREFCEKISHLNLASTPTMKRWFGIGGYAVPDRETVFSICFALELDEKQTEKFLVEGLKEPSFQINDYMEIIYLYGLERGLTQEECDDMAAEYEGRLDIDISFCRTHSTHELRKQYQVKKDLPRDEFLAWMVDNAKFFKGYSQTVLDYFSRYKKLILDSMKEDAEIVLQTLLEETEYFQWKRRRFIRETNLETIRRYIYSKKKIDAGLRENILEMAQIVYSETQPNTLLIRELFSFNYKVLSDIVKERNLFRMTEKRMSDLLGMAVQRERQMRSLFGVQALGKMDGEAPCPESICNLMTELGVDSNMMKTISVSQAGEWLKNYLKKQKRRCLLLQRGDILPMVIYMIQRDYMKKLSYDMDKYNAEEVMKYFEEVANATLSTCDMAPLNREYELDTLFYLCFQKSEMYSLADVLDVLENETQLAK